MNTEGMVTVKLFAWLRDVYGKRELRIDIEKAPDIQSLLRELRGLTEVDTGLSDSSVTPPGGFIVLLNGHSIHFQGGVEARLAAGDEVALFPPVAGG